MKLAEVQSEVTHWPDEQVNALAAFLTMLRLKRSDAEMAEISRRLDDKRPESWINLDDLKAKLAAESD
jgi:hypothetical protein